MVVGLEGAHMTDGGGLFFGVDHGAGAGWNQKGLNATPWSSGTSLRGAFALSRGGVINISPGDGYFNFSAGRIKYVPAGIGFMLESLRLVQSYGDCGDKESYIFIIHIRLGFKWIYPYEINY